MYQMTSSSDPTSVSSTKRSQKGTENSEREQTKFRHSQCMNGRSENKDLGLDEAIQSASKRTLNTSSSDEKNDDSSNSVCSYFL